jgi:hypothetical protein
LNSNESEEDEVVISSEIDSMAFNENHKSFKNEPRVQDNRLLNYHSQGHSNNKQQKRQQKQQINQKKEE